MSRRPRCSGHWRASALAGGAVAALAVLAVTAWATAASPGPAAAAAPGCVIAGGAKLGKGQLLVASRSLVDPNFSETVVLVLAHGPEGATGLVVNRRSRFKLAEVLPEVEGVATRADPLYAGGPIEPGRMLVLLRAAEALERTTLVFEDVHVAASAETLRDALGRNLDAEHLRVFGGYAGWGPGQLDAELGRGDWLVATPDVQSVFSTKPEKLWSEMIDRVSGQWVRLPAESSCRGG